MTVSRRALLRSAAAGSTAAVAGCLWGFGTGCTSSATLEMTPADDEAIADAYATPLTDLGPLDRQLARAAAGGERPTVTTATDTPDLRLDGDPVVHEGRYYRFSTSVVDRRTTTGYRLRFEAGEEVRTAATAAETITFEELPAADQRVLLVALLNEVAPKQRRAGGDSLVAFEQERTVVYPTSGAAASSELVPDAAFEYVDYDGFVFRVANEGTGTDVTARTHAVEATVVAESTGEFVEGLKGEYGVRIDPDSLSADEREVVETAIEDDHYDACLDETPPAAFGAVVERVFGVERLDEASGEERLVDYGGTWHRASFYVAVA
jgi:hypothetical protein